jgi:two-component system chemotaxis response regulator CheB
MMFSEPQKAAIVIGGSAGALEALSAILTPLPADYPIPIIIVVHVPADKDSALPELLKSKCKLDVREAEDKEPIKSGTVYIAPPNYHLQVEPNKYLSLSSEEPVMFSRPSIDILFETACDAYEDQLIAIILSGANDDGAKGFKLICAAGAIGVVQQPSTATARSMPEAALKACIGATVLKPEDIATYLLKVGSYD